MREMGRFSCPPVRSFAYLHVREVLEVKKKGARFQWYCSSMGHSFCLPVGGVFV